MKKFNTKSLLNTHFGLVNTNGVSCHFNAMIQCFLSCSSVIDTFMENKSLQSYNVTCINIWNIIDKDRQGALTLESFNAYVRNIWAEMVKIDASYANRQQDSSVSFRHLLDMIDREEIRNKFLSRTRVYTQCMQCRKITESVPDEAYIIVSDLKGDKDIKCRKIYVTDKKCNICGKISASSERIEQLSLISEIIILSPDFDKFKMNKTSIRSPETITIPAIDGSQYKYKKIAVQRYDGNGAHGHYWADAQRKNAIAKFNDSAVSQGNLNWDASTCINWYHLE